MKKNLLAAALLSMAATGVFAQAKSFEGFSVGINGSFVGNISEFSGEGAGTNIGDSNIIPSGEIGYTHAITDKFTLGISGTYDFMDANAGKVDTVQFKGKNHYSINIKPGFAVSKDALVYAIVGYNSVEGTTASNPYLTGSTTYTGIGYGVGTQIMFTPNIYGKVEIQQVQYDSKNIGGTTLSVKPSSNIGTIGIGYKF